MAGSFEEAAGEVAERLRVDAEMATVEVVLGEVERSGAPGASVPWRLMRSERDGTSDWIRISEGAGQSDDEPGAPAAGPGGPGGLPGEDGETYVVDIEAGGAVVGAIEATRVAGDPRPGRGARRILALAADQLGIAYRRDELSAELTTAEVARQSDALRAAILDSVSHDLRTPIATIRALAGGLLDPALPVDEAEARGAGAAIDEQAERLSGLVRGLLDMSRIQAGALHPDLAPYDLAELLDTALRRLLDPDGRGRIEVTLPRDLPPVHVDAVLFDVAVGNVLDNAVRHTPADAPIRVAASAAMDDGHRVALTIEDGGPGVPGDALPRLFDRFYRVPTGPEPARHGLGMGLAIARGFLEAMDGTIDAVPSALGGLAVRIDLPADPLAAREDEAPG
jgi:two-component system sensor histidine kinase KdpD